MSTTVPSALITTCATFTTLMSVSASFVACKEPGETSLTSPMDAGASRKNYLNFVKFGESPTGTRGVFGSTSNGTVVWIDGRTFPLELSATGVKIIAELGGLQVDGEVRFLIASGAGWAIRSETALSSFTNRISTGGAKIENQRLLATFSKEVESWETIGFGETWIASRTSAGRVDVILDAKSSATRISIPTAGLPGQVVGATVFAAEQETPRIVLICTGGLAFFDAKASGVSEWSFETEHFELPFGVGGPIVATYLSQDVQGRSGKARGILIRQGETISLGMVEGRPTDLFPEPVTGDTLQVPPSLDAILAVANSKCATCHASGPFVAVSADAWNAPSLKLRAHIHDGTMPPPGAPMLSSGELALLRAWVETK